MENYVDEKVTTWIRHYFTDDTDMEEVVKTIKECSFSYIFDDNFVESEKLDYEHLLDVSDNNGEATIEVYKNDKLIWNNAR